VRGFLRGRRFVFLSDEGINVTVVFRAEIGLVIVVGVISAPVLSDVMLAVVLE
jgi:hypothetical protein